MKKYNAVDYIIIVVLGIMAASCLIPILNTLAMSLSDKTSAAKGDVYFWPKNFNMTGYQEILKDQQFFRSFGISVLRVILGVTLNSGLAILMAYPLSKSKQEFGARNVYSWFFVITMLFNGGLIPTYLVVRNTGLIDSIWALILPTALPVFSMLVVMNYMRSLPKELEEAAFIDGASHLQTLIRIILPVSLPTLATVTLFSFVFHWNSWFDGMIYMNSVEKYPLQSYLQTVVINPEAFFRNASNRSTSDLAVYLELVNARTTNSAQLVLAAIPILLIYPFLQKYFTTGLVMGSVKE